MRVWACSFWRTLPSAAARLLYYETLSSCKNDVVKTSGFRQTSTCWSLSGSCDYLLTGNSVHRLIPGSSQGQCLWRGLRKKQQPSFDRLHVNSKKMHVDIRRAHELAPQCAWTYSWAAAWGGAYLCGLPTERRRWVIPAAIPSHSKRLTTGWPSKPLSGICLILAFCLHLSPAPRLKRAALLLFASLLGSEENDNNEAWRLSTASHTNIHTFNTRNTDVTTNCRHTHSAAAHPYIHTHSHICEMNAGSHKLLFVPCRVCKYKSVFF